ncbi:type I pantothenate kinase [Lentilactobacillus kosonis]|uniref:Pantothenate kinase n=1 Tax=Lentilactobacillus kosonis TaxID=2810561 RepID=A0A401FLV3_9LACO|nr:type I pantothenate kinase [Lentilactobacillus kosonis]GAY73350.1 pantothenate kinase [Lentilactobacillus kosonis]
MAELINYYSFSKDEWKNFYPDTELPLTENELKHIKAFNDQISLQDVSDIYTPLIHMIRLQKENFSEWQTTKAHFLHKPVRNVPFIIGISGSVAVGKSTTARVLEELLTHYFTGEHVQLITTDGFLYSTDELKKRGILDRKGFPESYDMEALIGFLNSVKSGVPVIKTPVYSHQVYDIIPDQFEVINRPDVLIVEGINTLQLPQNQQIYISDFTDFSIYMDADPDLIEKWYLERFGKLIDTAFRDPDNYYHQYAIGERSKAFDMAKRVWQTIDMPNLEENILPTRSRADMIMHKSIGHSIDRLYLRKY